MSLSSGLQSATYAATTNQDLTANPVIDGATKVPPQFTGFVILAAGQTDPKQNGLYQVTRNGAAATWNRLSLTSADVQVDATADATGQGRWVIVGTPNWGTDNVTVQRVK